MHDADAPPPLAAGHLDWWRAALARGADPGAAPDADCAGLQLLASALRHGAAPAGLDPEDGSPAARLWRRLGLDDPVGATVVRRGARVVALGPAP